ncbi:site-specific integrase [Vibrio cyclitrophicus]|nr:site-specific integrase [Vibrio cyclitrophicus]UPR51979.1 site-specific integrase [Vibrio cyclitrophicus]
MYKNLYHDVEIDGINIQRLHVYYDDDYEPVILPSLWLVQIAVTLEVWGWHTSGQRSNCGSSLSRKKVLNVETAFKAEPITENTLENYVGHVFKLLKHINKNPDLSIHRTENLTTRYLNHYLNEVLPEQLKSPESLKAHQSGIAAYCNFLCALGVWEKDNNRPTTIYRKTKQYMAEKDTRPLKINYVSSYEYNDLLRVCPCKRDKLLLQLGYEVGLRAEENTGLELNDYETHQGLRSMFKELESRPEKMEWEYTLRGKYTKGGRTGKIYIDRELLQKIKEYHDLDRAAIVSESGYDSPTLFVRDDPQGKGLPIGRRQATTTFRKARTQLPQINQSLSYHDLRHSFATKLYHDELLNPEGQETRSESAALEVVRQRLRHSEGSTTVKRYIRLRIVMLNREHKE